MIARDVYRFGTFTLDVGERRLSARGDTIRPSPKAFDLLATLVQDPGRLLTKHELLARVWPDVFVEEGILTVHVAALRKALGDETRRPSYIERWAGGMATTLSSRRAASTISRGSMALDTRTATRPSWR